MFLRLIYTGITKHACVQIWTVTEIIMDKNCSFFALPHNESVLTWYWSLLCRAILEAVAKPNHIQVMSCYVIYLEPYGWFLWNKYKFSSWMSLCHSDVKITNTNSFPYFSSLLNPEDHVSGWLIGKYFMCRVWNGW
jgi:hypothetical protein